MKKFLIFLLAAMLTLGLCACGDRTSEGPAATGENQTDGDQMGGDQTTDPSGSMVIEPSGDEDKTTLKLNSGTDGIRMFGERETLSASVINCNNAGSGFEVVLESEGGDVQIRTQTSDPVCFRVWVDGEVCNSADDSEYFEINGVKTIDIPELAEGEHTVRVIRVSDAGAGTAMFYNITFTGTAGETDAAPEEALFVEFVGDGITCGEALGGAHEDAAQAYAYLTANALNADYAIASFAGQGLTVGEKPIASNYAKQGNYERQADIVVVCVGNEDFALTGDQAVNAETFTAAYRDFLKSVRTVNGSQCKIVCVASSANRELGEAVANACDELGGENSGYYVKTFSVSSTVPTAEEHQAFATELAAYIDSIKDASVTLTTIVSEEEGYGAEIDYDAAEWDS